MSKKTYKKLFFDLDHTLWDFEKNTLVTLKAMMQHFELNAIEGFSFDKFFSAFRKSNDQLWKLNDRGVISKEEMRARRFPYIFELMKLDKKMIPKDIDHFFITTCPQQKNLINGSIELLEDLTEKGYRMSILTNGFSDVQHQKIAASGIDHYFEEVITADGSGYKKPDKRIFEYAINLCNTSSKDSLIIGDNLFSDIDGGIAANMDQVFFNEHKINHQKKPTYEIYKLLDLIKIL